MGHELDADVSPIETGMDRFARKQVDFVGQGCAGRAPQKPGRQER